MATEAAERFETVIVGGAQAGLAAAYYLTKRGRSVVVLDASERVGDSWRKRWPSLRLYSPARFDGLPGMRFPAPRHSYPSGHEMADYLEAYAQRFELPVRTGVHADGLFKNGEGYVVTAGERRIEADNVVVATGVFQEPFVPDFARLLDPRIRHLHSNDYRSPAQLQEGGVLVVGAAHSGGDIAFEVARAGHSTVLSGRDTGQIPVPLESRRMRVTWPVMRFLWTRVLTVDTPIGRKKRREIRAHGMPLLRVKAADLEAAGVKRVFARTVGVQKGLPMLERRTGSQGRERDLVHRLPPGLQLDRHPRSWVRTGTPSRRAAQSSRRLACTSSDCRSCTPSARCSSSARGGTPSAS